MAGSDQEIEVKFLVRDLAALARQLEALGAKLTSIRVRETNLRFDTLDGVMARTNRVLRLRQDSGAVMTYKSPSDPSSEVSSRQEIEIGVSDFATARRLLEALGYRVSVMYEKYRTTYALGEVIVVLDEMPYGAFVEIEGPDADAIHRAANILGLRWDSRSTASYLALFNALRSSRGLAAQNLSFSELEGVIVKPEDMGLRYADKSS